MKFTVVTLGCKVNNYESESYIESMIQAGYTYVAPKEVADIYIVNSCAVTNAAALKTRQQISRADRLNEDAMIVVVGCYAQVESEILKRDKKIDLLIGSNKKSQLVPLIEAALEGGSIEAVDQEARNFEYEDLEIVSFKRNKRAFLKIQDGCDQFCSYCIIPFARGQERSLSMEKVLEHAHYFVKNNHKEIVLSGIHTGRYGKGLDVDLYTLMTNLLQQEEALSRLRVSSIEVLELSDDIIELSKADSRMANHWHIPLQSGSDKILKLMNRRYTTQEYRDRILDIQNTCKDVSISADVIVGFPQETDEDFRETYRFIESLNLSFLHVFPYSSKSNTKAESLAGHVENSVKKQRVRELRELSDRMKHKFISKFINKTVSVLVEGFNDNICSGYSSEYFEVRFESDSDLVNELRDVKIYKVEGDIAYGKQI